MNFFSKNKVINSVVLIPIRRIVSNPNQPRVIFMQEDLKDLAESIRNNGILQPLTVRINSNGKYELVAGERRLKAAKIVGKKEVPCIVLKTSIEQSAILALMENLQRKNLNFFEEAIAINKLIEKWQLTQHELALKLGKAQSTIANKLRILKFSSEQKRKILFAGLTERHARALLKISNEEEVDKVLDFIILNKLNVDKTEEYVRNYLKHDKKNKRKIIPVIKDVRICTNTLNNAVKLMRKAGVMAKMQKQESSDCLTYIITIPNGIQKAARVNV